MGFPHFVIARLHEHIEPIDRGNRYEDPLQAALDQEEAGRVTGGGSQLNESGSIDFVDIETELADLDSALDLTIATLANAGAPRGSEIIEGNRVVRDLGFTSASPSVWMVRAFPMRCMPRSTSIRW